MPPDDENLTRDDLKAVLADAVESALEAERAESSRRKAVEAADEVERENLGRRLKRVKVYAGAIVAVVSVAAGGVTWVYAQGQRAEAAAARELRQDRLIDGAKADLGTHVQQATAADRTQSTKIKNLGALQIEQGNDQRTILLESAPKRVRDEHKEKPAELTAAEGRVLRD